MVSTFTACLLGVVLGMRHALEPDHLTAISTLVMDQRGARRGALLGMSWGVGHTASLFGVGMLLVALEARMPPRLADGFELGVAAMLIGLGVRSIAQAVRLGAAGAPHPHRHGGLAHTHAAGVAHLHVGRVTLARRPLLVGLMHGLAGSGALTAAVIADLPSTGARLAYIALFGAGSVLGMAAMTGLVGVPLARLGEHARTRRLVITAAGVLSIVVGVAWGAPLIARLA